MIQNSFGNKQIKTPFVLNDFKRKTTRMQRGGWLE